MGKAYRPYWLRYILRVARQKNISVNCELCLCSLWFTISILDFNIVMSFRGVICRLVALLDIVLIMLGLLVICMANSQIINDNEARVALSDEEIGNIDIDSETVRQQLVASQLLKGLTLVYAETAQGQNFDRCFLLDINGKPNKEIQLINAKHPSDVPEIKTGMTIVLLISDAGFDSRWTLKRIREIEAKFEIKIVTLYNINLGLQ
jgi:hypothetical protein